MQIIIGIGLIIAGMAYGIYMFKKNGNKSVEMQYMQTTSIADAADIVDAMTDADPNYHHYVEIKGTLQSEDSVVAPFIEKAVAYYENKCYAVNEEKRTMCDSNGNTTTRMVKVENEITSEKSSVPMYITDNSSDIKVYIDIESFGSDKDLQSGCDRFEPKNSTWLQYNINRYSWGNYGGAQLLGYRLKESVLYNNQPVYVLGELYKHGDRMCIGKSVVAKKPSMFSYKSEDQLVSDTKREKVMSLVFGGGAAAVGLVMVFMYIF